MKKINKLIAIGTLAALPFFPSEIKAQDKSNEDYGKIGSIVKRFHNSNADEKVGNLFGFETAYGKKITRDIRSEIYNSNTMKSKNDLKITNIELGVFFDYNPEHFYVGLGPKISYLEQKTKGNLESIFGYGFAGRIGYSPKIMDGLKLYFELNYSKLAHKEGEDILDLGTIGLSLGLEF